MSYILSALRKAERERNATAAPSVDRFLDDRGPERGVTAALPAGRWIILALATALAASLGYLVLGGATDPDSAATLPPVSPAPIAAPAPAVEDPQPAHPLPTAERSADQPTLTVSASSSSSAARTSPVSPAPSAPPAPAPRSPMPALNITGYIYFESDPARSKLFVDGIVYRLHSRVDEGLVITGFGPDTVTLSHYGEPRTLSVR